VTIKLTRGKRVVKTYTVRAAKAGENTLAVRVARAKYTVAVTPAGGATVTRRLTLGR
jgi:hypothetical protein